MGWLKKVYLPALMFVFFSSACSQTAAAQGGHTAIRAPRLIDGKSQTALSNAVILVENDKITAVGSGLQIPADVKVIDRAKLSREDLEAGITTVRHLGNSGVNGDVALRDAVNNGWLPGPRIVAATRALAAQGGQFGPLTPQAQSIIEQEYVTIRGAESARQAVRQALSPRMGPFRRF